MGFERQDNHPAGPEWAQPSRHAASAEVGAHPDVPDTTKDKKKKKKAGKHRASAERPAFNLDDYLARQQQRESYGTAAVGAAVVTPGEFWSRSAAQKTADHELLKSAPHEMPTTSAEFSAEAVAAEAPQQNPSPAETGSQAAPWQELLANRLQAMTTGPETPHQAVYEASANQMPYQNLEARALGTHEQAAKPGDIPPVPPSFHEYERVVMRSTPEKPAQAAESVSPAAARAESGVELPSASQASAPEIPVGLQRTPDDVSRAAWGGAIAGWLVGRRGKRKAVQQARRAGIAEGLAARQHHEQQIAPVHQAAEAMPAPAARPVLEAAPIHTPTSGHESDKSRHTAVPLAVETRPVPPAETARSGEAPRAARVPEADVTADMKRGELMKVARKIKIEGVSLKDIYNAKRIDADGLRTVVESYLRGGDYQQKLSDEVIAKEQSFERDPYMRHVRPDRKGELAAMGSRAGAGISSAAIATRGLLQEKGTQLAAASHKSAQQTAHRAGKFLVNGARQAHHDIIDTSHSADWIGITAIVIVYSLILLLLLR